MPASCPHALLFSDVDETFLDHGTLRPELQLACLATPRQIEIIFTSSRTVAEITAVQAQVNLAHADLIAEDGACIRVSSRALAEAMSDDPQQVAADGDHWVVSHATPVPQLRQALLAIAEELNVDLQSLLSVGDPHRYWSVLLPIEADASHLLAAALFQRGFAVGIGTQWICISIGGGKGPAVARYLAAREAVGALPTVVAAIGDAGNDATMLRAVPRAFVIRRERGDYHPDLATIPNVTLLQRPGTEGWLEALAMVQQALEVAA